MQSVDSSNLTNDGATTQRLSAGSGSFIAGEVSEDGLVDNWQLTANNHSEHLYAIKLVAADLANSDALTFRVLRNGATFTYSVTPTINVTKTAAVFAITQAAYRFYDDGTEAGANAAASENAALSVTITNGVPSWRGALRVRLDETGTGSGAGAATDDYQLQVSKNGGGFADVANRRISGSQRANDPNVGGRSAHPGCQQIGVR